MSIWSWIKQKVRLSKVARTDGGDISASNSRQPHQVRAVSIPIMTEEDRIREAEEADIPELALMDDLHEYFTENGEIDIRRKVR